jgi:serine/threonine-protein kinase
VAVPCLQGVTVPEAQEFLQGRGLNWRVVPQVSDQPAGTVIDTDPPEGTQVPAGTEVTLFVATPPPSSAVPDPSNP